MHEIIHSIIRGHTILKTNTIFRRILNIQYINLYRNNFRFLSNCSKLEKFANEISPNHILYNVPICEVRISVCGSCDDILPRLHINRLF